MTLVCNSFPVLANFRKTDNLISEFYFRKSWPLQKCMWPSCSNTCTLQEKFDEFVRCPLDIFLFPNEIYFRNSERTKTPKSTKLVLNFGRYRKPHDPVLR